MGTSELLDTATRRAYVLKLRKGGATYAEIAKSTLNHFGIEQLPRGWDERYAWQDVNRELQKLRTEIADDAESVLTLELQRLDDLLKGVWIEAVRPSPDHAAIDRVLKIMQRRASILGLDTQRHELNINDTRIEVSGFDV